MAKAKKKLTLQEERQHLIKENKILSDADKKLSEDFIEFSKLPKELATEEKREILNLRKEILEGKKMKFFIKVMEFPESGPLFA